MKYPIYQNQYLLTLQDREETKKTYNQMIQTEHEQIDVLRFALYKVHGKSVGSQKVKKTTFTVYYIAILENVSNVLPNHI